LSQTAIEKVISRISGVPQLHAGDVVNPVPDLIMIHDGVVKSSKVMLDKIGILKLSSPEKVIMVSDHDVLYGSAKAAERGSYNRQAAKEWGVGQFYDVGQGGHGHIFPMEEGQVLPGMFYFDNDTHATNAGAVGAFGIRLGLEISTVLATGSTWFEVPKTVRIRINGHLSPRVQARDIGFYLARLIKSGIIPLNLDNRVLEYCGETEQFGLGERVALCSSPTEMRAVGVFIPPSQRILKYCETHAKKSFQAVYSDSNAIFESEYDLNISELAPQVVQPGSVSNAVEVTQTLGVKIDHAFIGSCGSGMYDDLLSAASVLKGRRVAPGVRLFIVPGSQKSMNRLVQEGLMQIFLDAGALVLPPGCGPCNDAVVGPLAAQECSISTATNSNAGRFGSRDAKLYLGSPLTVAASATTGQITDPRTLEVDASMIERAKVAYD